MTNNNELMIINEESIKDKIFVLRGIPVMLDRDLAIIYGYDVKYLNRQVQRNIAKFPEDMMFQLTYEESLSCSWCQNGTMNKSNDHRGFNLKYLPYAFTEQGIYMLMTVLKGELAVKQSLSLVRLFKKMKDAIIKNQNLLTNEEIQELTLKNTRDIKKVNKKIDALSNKIKDDVYPLPYIISDGKKYELDKYFINLFKKAKYSLIIIDPYIGIKTLDYTVNVKNGVKISMYGEKQTRASGLLTEHIFNDFKNERPDIDVSIYSNQHRIHDRFIIFDYDTPEQKTYILGQSIKDAGKKISTITEIHNTTLNQELKDIIDTKTPYKW